MEFLSVAIQEVSVVLVFKQYRVTIEIPACGYVDELLWCEELLSNTFLWCCLFYTMYRILLTFDSVGTILKRDHPNESYRAVLSCYVVHGRANVWVARCDQSNES